MNEVTKINLPADIAAELDARLAEKREAVG